MSLLFILQQGNTVPLKVNESKEKNERILHFDFYFFNGLKGMQSVETLTNKISRFLSQSILQDSIVCCTYAFKSDQVLT